MFTKSQSDQISKLVYLLSIVWILTSLMGIQLAQAETPMDKKNREESQRGDKELNEVLKRLPPSSRVLVRCKVDIFTDMPSEKVKEFVDRAKPQLKERCPDIVEQLLIKNGITPVDRSILIEADKETELADTGILDPKTSAQYGQMKGITHVVTSKWLVNCLSSSQTCTTTMTFIFTRLETGEKIGSVTAEQTSPFTVQAPQPLEASCNLTGRYNTTFGPMQLQQTGNEIAGSYQYGNVGGSIRGNVNSGVVEWEWIQSNGDKGFGRWDILAGCVGLNGNWGRWTYDTNAMSPTYMKAVPAWQGKWDAQKFAQ